MLNWSNFAGGTAAAAIMVSLLGLTGCSQLSKTARQERVEAPQKAPVPPDFREPKPQLKPVPAQAAELPDLPPPAPPSESARKQSLNRDARDEFAEQEDDAGLVSESDEFFDAPGPSIALERVNATAARYAEKGNDAARRKELEVPWPVIIPAKVPQLQKSDEPALLPVPR